MIGLEHYTPTPQQLEDMGRLALSSRFDKLMYKKIDKGILAYHSRCGHKGIIDKKTLDQVKYSHLCPFCCDDIKSTTQKTHNSGYQFVKIKTSEDEVFGYYVLFEYEMDEKIFLDCEQVYYGSGNDCYHRYLGFDCFANNLSLCPNKEDWKYSKRSSFSSYYYQNISRYEDAMWSYNYFVEQEPSSKRKYLENKGSFIEKSNQKKIAIDNLLTVDEMKLMKVFDLKSIDEIEKYKAYARMNSSHMYEFLRDKTELNIHYLDYLSRNKIDLGKYYTFMENLKLLGFKNEKPTDFQFRSERVSQMVTDKKNELMNKAISERFNELPRYSKDNVAITPFENADDIRQCGKTLHNCIGGYVERYATKKTDIYHLDLDGALKIAIEICDNTLEQAYADKNSKCPTDLMEHIKSFCNSNGFSLGSYA